MSNIYNLTDTWNAAGTVYTAIKMNVTDTASAASSKILDLQLAGATKLSLDKNGNLVVSGNTTIGGALGAVSLTLSQALAISSGGTGGTTASTARVSLLPTLVGNSAKVLAVNTGATDVEWVAVGTGSVTSVQASGGSTGLTFSGGPITTSGTITLGGVLALASGGTGGITPAAARVNILPSYTGNGAKVLAVNTGGTDVEWVNPTVGAASGANADITSMSGITGGISSPDFIQFDTSPTVTPAEGRLYFNTGEGGLSYVLKGGNVVQEVGQSQQVLIYNGTGSTLTKGQVVYSNGAQGQRPTVALAIATSDATCARTLGIVAETIANGAEGWVTSLGIIENIDTSSFTAGAQLYLSGTVAGGLTQTKTSAPTHMVYVARCIKSHASAGRLFVTVQNGYEMDELHDVSVLSPSNNQGLFYNTTTSLWENKSIVTALGYTPYNATNPSGYTSNTGTVTSVGGTGTVSGLTLTGTVTTTGSLTLGGTLAVTASNFASQTANTFLAAPNGSAGTPTFRAIVAADIPTLNQNTTGSAATLTTARTINGTSFNGSANITTTSWGTSRTITIGSTGKSVDGSANLTWTFPEIDGGTALGAPRSNLGDPTVREMALFDEQFTNKTTLYDINNLWFESSTDGITWTDVTVSDTNKRRFLTGDTGTSIAIPYGTAYYRIKLRATGYVYLNAFYAYTSTSGHSTQIQVYKKHDSGTYTQHTSATNTVGSWPGHFYLPFSTVPFHSAGTLGTHFHEIYIVFIPTWNATYPANSITLYKGQFWGGYPAGKRNIYSTDELGNVTFPGTLTATTLTGTISSGQVTTALGYTPYNSTNPSGYTSNTGTVTSVGGTGTVAGLTLTGTVTTTGNLTLGGTLSTPVSTINDSTTVGQNLVKLTNPSAITFLRVNADNTVSTLDAATFRTAIGAGTSSAAGTVTSVAMTVPTGLTVAGSPITSTGTLAVTLTAGYSIPTTTSQTNWDTAYTDRLKWDGGSTGLTAATGRTSLGATTVGGNLFTLTNPTAITFLRVNADNTVSTLDAATFRTAIGAGTSSTIGTVTSVGGTGTVAGLTLTGTVTSTGNLTLGGTLSTPISTINDSTTVGQNLVKLSNPTAVTFLRVNADNTVSTLDAATFRTAIGAGTSSTSGTVTSVGGTGTVAGLTLTGTVTSTGNLTLGGTLSTPVSTINDSTTVGQNLVKLTNPTAITFLRVNADNTVSTLDAATFRTAIGAGTSSTAGTVTSVAMTVPTGLTITGTPITSSGTLAITLTAGYSIPTTTSQTNWDTAYTDRNKWDGGSTGLTATTGRTSLGATTVGSNLFTLTNPTAITFLRVNADNTVSTLDAATFRTAIGAGTSSTTGTVTSVGGTGTVAGLTLTGTVTSTGNLTLGGTFSSPISTISDSTTVGQNLVKLTNPTAVTYLRVNADNTVSTLDAATFRTAIGAGTSSTTGTVTSVGGTGTVAGLTLTGTVTSTGNLTLGGTLAVTASDFASQTANTFLAAPNGAAGTPTFRAIVAADIPTLNQNTTGTAASITGTYSGTITSSQVTTGLGFTPYNSTNPSGYISANQSIALSGDASGTGTTAITVTLANSGVTAGTYNSVTVNAKGLVTGGTVKQAPNVQSVTSAATVTPNADTNDLVSISAQAVGLTIAAPSGTSTDGEKLLIRIKDNGTTRTISWNAVYVAAGSALPTATTAGKWHHIGLIYNGNTSTWMCIAAAVQA